MARKIGVFEQMKAGLEECLAHVRGELSLKTTELPSPPPKAGPKDVSSLRKRHGMSQSVFAATLNVSTRTVQSWEQGLREPSDAALRMLEVIRRKPQVVDLLFGRNGRGKSAARRRASPREKVAS